MNMTDIVYIIRVNWRQIFLDLSTQGISGYRVAQLMQIEWSTVQHWLNGGEPRHGYGQALLSIHSRYCGESLTKFRLEEAKP